MVARHRTDRRARPLKRATPTARRVPRRLAAKLMRAVHGRPALFAAAVAALSLLLAALTFQPTPHTGGDNASYITLARSLLERGAYLELYDPAEPPHTQYPPVFPGILAVALALGLQPWVQLKALIALFGAAAAALSFLWIRRRGRPLLALGVGALLAAGPGVLTEMHWVLSDVPFWFFTAFALWAWERLPPRAGARFAFAVAATVLAYFTRSAGLPLAVAAFAWLAYRRRWRQLAILVAVLAPLALLWWLRARTHGGVDYVGQFLSVNPYSPELGRIGIADLPARMIENAGKYLRLHLPILLTGRPGGWMLAGSIVVVALALIGWVRRLRRPGVAELFIPLYLGLLLVWPAVWSGERFLLPVLPALLLHAGAGLSALARAAGRGAAPAAGAAAVALILLLAAPALRRDIEIGSECTLAYRLGERYPCLPPEWADYFAIAEWTAQALPEGAVVITRKPRLFYVLSGRQSRIFPLTEDPNAFFTAADEAGARFLVFDFVDGLSSLYVRPALLRRPQAFCILYSSPRAATTVFGILPGARELPDRADETAPPAFQPCGLDYWKSSAARDAALGGRGT